MINISIPASWLLKLLNKFLEKFGKKIVDIDSPEFPRCPTCGYKTTVELPSIELDSIGRPMTKKFCINPSCPRFDKHSAEQLFCHHSSTNKTTPFSNAEM
jgi:hypothetical protein